MTTTNKKEQSVLTAAVLVKLPREHEIFKNQAFRILRECAKYCAIEPEMLPRKQLIQILYKLADTYRLLLNKSNKDLMECKALAEKYMLTDANAYEKEIDQTMTRLQILTSGNANLRDEMNTIKNEARALESGKEPTAFSLAGKIAGVIRVARSVKNFYKDKEAFDWALKDSFETVEDFKKFLKDNSINEQQTLMEDFGKTLRVEIERFRTHLEDIKQFVKLYDEDLYPRIAELNNDDLTDVSTAVNFVADFNQFYHKIKHTQPEEFLKIEGVSTELCEAMDVIIGIRNTMKMVNLDLSNQSMDNIQKMIDSSIEQNTKRVEVSYAISEMVSATLFDLEDPTPEEISKCKTLLLSSIFMLKDIRSGSSTINLIGKLF